MNLKIHYKQLLLLKKHSLALIEPIRKLSLAMRLTTLLIFIASVQISAKSYSQKISLNVKNATLNIVLKEIREQSGYQLVYNTDYISDTKPVTANFSNVSIEESLKYVLHNQPLRYTIRERTIVISPISTEINKQQRVTITGRILDETDQPIPGVSITEKGTKNTVMANANGEFRITVEKFGVPLVIRSIGFSSQEIPASSTPMRIKLKGDVQNLNDVIITGYQQIKKESLTGSVSRIKAEDINVASMGTLDKMLQGQVAGVAVETSSSVFGTAPKIRVRGNASISGVQEPLWVLDGVPLEAPLNIAPTELYSGGARNLLASALSGVNPEDIEDITVLKDATATAMYGTRAVNGVIVITTKRAKKNSPLVFNYSANATVTLKPSINSFDVLNSKDQTELNEEIFETYQNELMSFTASTTGAYSNLQYLRNVKGLSDEEYRAKIRDMKMINTDWFDHLYKTSLMQQHSLSATFGSSKFYGRGSVSFYNDLGKAVGEKVLRHTLSFTAGYQVSKRFTTEVLLKYANRTQNNAGVGVNPFLYAREAARNMQPYGDQGGYQYYKRGFADFNILEEIKNNHIRLENDDYLVQLDLKYKASDRLKFNALFNTRQAKGYVNEIFSENSNYVNQFRVTGPATNPYGGYLLASGNSNPRLYKDPNAPSSHPAVTVIPVGGILDRETTNSRFYTGRVQGEWNVLVDNSGHSLTIMAGAEAYSNGQKSYFNRGYGYSTTTGQFNPDPLAIRRLQEGVNLPEDERRNYLGINLLQGKTSYSLPYKRNTISYYTNASYNYKEKYVLEGSFRNDAANITLTRFTPTWAVGASWNIGKEDFLKDLNTISDVKLRASYGLRGNDGARGPNLAAFNEIFVRVYPILNQPGISITEPENQSLEFEKEHILNLGLDFTLFNKLDISFNAYKRDNFGLIAVREVALSLGYAAKSFNWADMTNKGLELSINLRPIDIAENLKFNLNLNGAYNKNEVTSDLTGSKPNIFAVSNSNGFAMKGGPVSGLYAFRLAGLNASGLPQYYDGNGNIVPTFSSINTNYGNLEYQGSREPVYSGGFTPTIKYKNVTLSAAFIFNAGHVVRLSDYYKNGTRNSLFRDDINASGDFADRWTAIGDEKYTIIPKLITDLDIEYYRGLGFANNFSMYAAYNNNNMRTVDASYLRFRNVNLQFNFPEFAKKSKMQNFSVGLEASNIAIWASDKLKGQDPESLLSGLNTPPVKSFTLSLNASF